MIAKPKKEFILGYEDEPDSRIVCQPSQRWKAKKRGGVWILKNLETGEKGWMTNEEVEKNFKLYKEQNNELIVAAILTIMIILAAFWSGSREKKADITTSHEPVQKIEIEASEPSEPIYIADPEPAAEIPASSSPFVATQERALIEAVVAAEAKGEDFDGQCLVAQCILNTAKAKGISPAEVVSAPGQYASPDYASRSMVADAVAAVFDQGYRVTDEPIRYFYSPRHTYSSWHENSRTFVLEHGNHRFFK